MTRLSKKQKRALEFIDKNGFITSREGTDIYHSYQSFLRSMKKLWKEGVLQMEKESDGRLVFLKKE